MEDYKPNGIWMLVGKDAQTAYPPFEVPKEVLTLNPYDHAVLVNLKIDDNRGFAVHSHWINEKQPFELVYPIYVFLTKPIPGLEPDGRIVDPTNEKIYGNAYGMYQIPPERTSM